MLAVESASMEAEEGASARHRLCDMCVKEVCKYRCPRCYLRTCSLVCCKAHKLKYECSGERECSRRSFDAIRRMADFSPSVAVGDEKFLNSVSTTLNNLAEHAAAAATRNAPLAPASSAQRNCSVTETDANPLENSARSGYESDGIDVVHESEQVTSSQLGNESEEAVKEHREDWKKTLTRRYLLNNAHRRRIWLTVTPEKGSNSSRHEQFSDTIFWTIKLVFRQEQGEGPERAIIEYEHTVNNIPESISVATLLRQFIKPKKVGPVVSESDLDAEKLLPFQKAGIEQLMVYMPVPLDGKQRFYVIDPSKTILDNTRNRYILEHPTLIVTLNSQFGDYVMLSEQESQELRELQRQKNRDENANVRFNNFRGRGRFGNGRFISRGRGSGRRGFKRPYDSVDESGQVPARSQKFARIGRGSMHQNRGINHKSAGDGTWFKRKPYEAGEVNERPLVPSVATDSVVNAWSQAVKMKSVAREFSVSETK